MSFRAKFLSALFLFTLVMQAQAATTTVEMLRTLFRRPVTEWREVLKTNRSLLDDKFFQNVEKRIRWGIENNHIDDAFRFAMLGDFASETKNKPANFRIDLANLFFNAGNQIMTGQICDNISVTSPDTPAAREADFLRARLWEMQKNLFQAHETFVTLARKGYKPAECWYKAAWISMAVQEESRGLEEMLKAKKAGHIQAAVDYEKLKNQLGGDWAESLPAIPNRSEGATNEGITIDKGPDKTALVADAMQAAQAGKLDQARAGFEAAYKTDKNDPNIVKGYAAVLYRQGALGEAKAFLDAAIGRNAKDAELLRFRANVSERMFDRNKKKEHLTEAIIDYRQATKLAPNHPFLGDEYKRALSKQ